MSTSVLTIVRGRDDHLRNLMEGLCYQTRLPAELVIAWMQPEKVAALPDMPFPVRHIFVSGDAMPLAAARNRAADAAQGENLVFLDVDCIASMTTVEAYSAGLDATNGMLLGEVFYLPGGIGPFRGDYSQLDLAGVPHPSKPDFPQEGLSIEADAGQLWGLSFALRKTTWTEIGGMDEAFYGYGAEETDLARKASDAGLPTYLVAGARAYHQHHAVHIPPLQHFDHIVRNASIFHEKHGRWCMDYWLGQFQERGFIEWHDQSDRIVVRQRPGPDDISAAKQPNHILFS